jgi:hypothetical protein
MKFRHLTAQPAVVKIIAVIISLKFLLQFQVTEKWAPFGKLSHTRRLKAANAVSLYLCKNGFSTTEIGKDAVL